MIDGLLPASAVSKAMTGSSRHGRVEVTLIERAIIQFDARAR
jgi:hypothetical protein